jgi:hypothetical protein
MIKFISISNIPQTSHYTNHDPIDYQCILNDTCLFTQVYKLSYNHWNKGIPLNNKPLNKISDQRSIVVCLVYLK